MNLGKWREIFFDNFCDNIPTIDYNLDFLWPEDSGDNIISLDVPLFYREKLFIISTDVGLCIMRNNLI